MFAFTPFAFALHSPEHYSLFSDAEYVSPGNASGRAVHIASDPGFGGVNFPVEAGMTFADLDVLSTDYKFETDDSCAGGSPRFQVKVDTGAGVKNIFAYIGPHPNYTGCAPDVWTNTGDLLEAGKTVDTSQLPGGTFYDAYADAVADFGALPVVSVQLVVDGSWAFGDNEQALDVDNTLVDTTLFTYEVPVPTSKDQCKKGGWQNFADDEGNVFKNQGDCVSFVASQGKNKGSGN